MFGRASTGRGLLGRFRAGGLGNFKIRGLRGNVVTSKTVLRCLSVARRCRVKRVASLSHVRRSHFMHLSGFAMHDLRLMNDVGRNNAYLLSVVSRAVDPVKTEVLGH